MGFDCSFEDVVGMEATDRVRGEQVVWHRTLHHIVCGVVGSHLVSP